MSETTTTQAEQEVPEAKEVVQESSVSEKLAASLFNIELPNQEQPKQEQQSAEPVSDVKQDVKEEQKAPEVNLWHKDFGWETEDAAKSEIAELKKLKEQKPEYKFENEESKRLAEAISKNDRKAVLEILATQDKLDNLLSAEVNDETAEAIIKLRMELKHKKEGLSQREIDYKFNKDFGLPKEPQPKDDDLDGEFEARKAEWQEMVNDIKMNRQIEAKLAKSELEQLKTKIVLPNIQDEVQGKQPTKEELEAAEKYRNSYIQSVENSVKNFNGFSVSVKHDDVDLPVAYGVTEDEKGSLAKQLKDFAESNYDANALLAPRWVREDGTLKVEQMVKDLSVLNNADKAFQKFATDASSKVLEAYLKNKKQIDVTSKAGQGTTVIKEEKTEADALRDFFFA